MCRLASFVSPVTLRDVLLLFVTVADDSGRGRGRSRVSYVRAPTERRPVCACVERGPRRARLRREPRSVGARERPVEGGPHDPVTGYPSGRPLESGEKTVYLFSPSSGRLLTRPAALCEPSGPSKGLS